jgi:hypothetical protein
MCFIFLEWKTRKAIKKCLVQENVMERSSEMAEGYQKVSISMDTLDDLSPPPEPPARIID